MSLDLANENECNPFGNIPFISGSHPLSKFSPNVSDSKLSGSTHFISGCPPLSNSCLKKID